VSGNAAFDGIAGDWANAVAPYTEADPVGILAVYLAAAGNAIGPTPHIVLGATTHRLNEFVTVVGMTSTARKSDTMNVGLLPARHVDPDWFAERVRTGFGSGEGLVRHVRDIDGTGEQQDRRLLMRDGELGGVLEIPSGVSANPPSVATVAAREHFIRMQGKKLFPFAVRTMEESLRRCMEIAEVSADGLEMVISHQANVRIIDAVRERLGVSPDKVPVNIDRYGNTSSASIPISLDELVREGRIQPGDLIGFCAFGGGATWGASIIRWTMARQPSTDGVAASATRLAATGPRA